MAINNRGADIVVQALKRASVGRVFALSGNHIMSLFDALLGSGIEIIHTRHEAACVHMADAHARLTGTIGVALVTGGQGFTNAAAGLPTALAADSPVLLLSGDTATNEVGRGAFQELDQVAMSRPVTKASWRAETSDDLGNGILRAISAACSGRPGPVHVALPSDLLEQPTNAKITATAARTGLPMNPDELRRIAGLVAASARPIVLAGPLFARPEARKSLDLFERQTRVPVMLMESPRGLNDPSLGAFAEVVREADLVILLGKPLDFTLKFGAPPHISDRAKFIDIDPDEALIARATREHPGRVMAHLCTDPEMALGALGTLLSGDDRDGWFKHALRLRDHRPPNWSICAGTKERLHPIEMCRAVHDVLARDVDSIFIADGGEVGQWAQACISAPRRVINGVAGSIGASIPFAIAARVVERRAPIIAVMGDGTFGFHMAEFDTAVRHDLPFVAVVGNDALWNAEHQLQVRTYGADRAHSCGLLPTAYHAVATALGGYGECVTTADQLPSALARAIASGKPACLNVMTESHPAPTIQRDREGAGKP